MTCSQLFWVVIFPPFAVANKGCEAMFLVGLLTLCGWIPGSIAALMFIVNDEK